MSQPTGNPPGRYPNPASYTSPSEPPPPYAPPGQYPSPAQYPPPTQQPPYSQQYPPSSYPRQQYGPSGAYYPPPASGRYPANGGHGQYSPSVAPGQYPPPDISGAYPPLYPALTTPPPSSIGPNGYDTFDSDTENFVCTKDSKHPIEVTFTNRTRMKVTIYWIDEDGKYEKITSIKPNTSKDIDTWETHPFVAEAKIEVVINGNFVFIPQKFPGSHGIQKAEITEAPKDIFSLRSPLSGFPVIVKFSNRTREFVSIKWMNVEGQPQLIKDIAPEKAWVFNSCEGHYFIACTRGDNDNNLEMNKGWFYLARRAPNPQGIVKVLITRRGDPDSGSNSSSDE